MKDTILAQSDEFTIVQDDSEFVHVIDGEDSIRLTMDRTTLDNLVNQLLAQRLVAKETTCFEEENYIESLDWSRECYSGAD